MPQSAEKVAIAVLRKHGIVILSAIPSEDQQVCCEFAPGYSEGADATFGWYSSVVFLFYCLLVHCASMLLSLLTSFFKLPSHAWHRVGPDCRTVQSDLTENQVLNVYLYITQCQH